MCHGDRNSAIRHLVKEEGLTVIEANASLDELLGFLECGYYSTPEEALAAIGLDSSYRLALQEWP